MKKMTLLVSVENGCAAEKVMKSVKDKLGLKKGSRVLKRGKMRALFVNGIIQRNITEVEELAKYREYDMVVIPCFDESVKAFPRPNDIKMYINNKLGFSVFVVGVPKSPNEEQTESAVESVCDMVKANIGL